MRATRVPTAEPSPPLGAAGRTAPAVGGARRRRPLLVGELACALFLLIGYDRVAAFASGRSAPAVAHGRELLATERYLQLGVEYPLNRALAAHPGLGQVLSVYYDFAHGLVTFGVLAVLYLRCPADYRPARRALVALNIAAFAVFESFPVAPPRLLPGSGFTDIVARSGTWGSWETSGGAAASHADLYAAFPSLHVAQASWVLLAVLAATRRRWLRGPACAHLALTVLIVLSTGNHYLIDVAGGAGLAVLTWWAVQLWTPGRAPLPVAVPVPALGRATGPRLVPARPALLPGGDLSPVPGREGRAVADPVRFRPPPLRAPSRLGSSLPGGRLAGRPARSSPPPAPPRIAGRRRTSPQRA